MGVCEKLINKVKSQADRQLSDKNDQDSLKVSTASSCYPEFESVALSLRPRLQVHSYHYGV